MMVNPNIAVSWFQRFKQAQLEDAAPITLYEIVKEGEAERLALLSHIETLRETITYLRSLHES